MGMSQMCTGAGDYFRTSKPHSEKLWWVIWRKIVPTVWIWIYRAAIPWFISCNTNSITFIEWWMRVFWKRHKTIYCWFIFGCIFCNSCQFRGSHHHHHHMVVISSGGTRVTQSQVLRAVSSTSCTNTSPPLIYIILGRQQCTVGV